MFKGLAFKLIDVGDGCWRPKMFVLSKSCQQLIGAATNIQKLSKISNHERQDVTNIDSENVTVKATHLKF